jgi:hypothetical protein
VHDHALLAGCRQGLDQGVDHQQASAEPSGWRPTAQGWR